MKLEHLSENIWHSLPVEETDRPILAGIRGDEFALIIDAGNSEKHHRAFVEALEDMAFPKRHGVVLTHWHWDHIFGAAAVEGALIAHKGTRRMMRELSTYEWTDEALAGRVADGREIAFCRDCMVKELPSPRRVTIRLPEIEIADRLTIDLGTTTCLIEHVGSEHAQDHLVIYSDADRVLFIGDILFVDLYNGDWHWTPRKVEILIGKLLSYPADWFVASHVYPVQSRQEFEADCDWIRWIGQVTESADSMETVEDMIQEQWPNRLEEGLEMAAWFMEGLRREKEK